ncbi:MAG: hypothetical protein DLM57_07800 [Pseudonocardiales bacterium]|nr:MAG: hypothetical protein DLM57_07800 [Pseudonocardiales bacterium]
MVAAALTAGLVGTGLVGAGAQSAGAAALPQAQSVGNFLDGALGGGLIDPIVKLAYATAFAPGRTSVQNPLDVTALNAVNLPLTGALNLPEVAGIKLGAVNQVAHANLDGSSFGASGAVDNCGGVSVGCPNSSSGSFPANATVDLSAAGLSAGSPIPIPGGTSAAALGGIKLSVGAVSALAQTPVGFGKPGTTNYNIAGLTLGIGSPALGQLLSTLSKALNPSSVLRIITPLIKGVVPECDLTQVLLPTSLSLEGGAIVISATDGSITVDLAKLLQQLHLNLNQLPPNTDLIDYLLTYLTSVDGLTTGIEGLIHGLTDNLQAQFAACSKAVPLLPDVLAELNKGQQTLEAAVNGLVGSLGGVGGTGNPLAPLGAVLKKLIDIGVNVQPNGPAGTFSSSLKATPKQGTPAVAGQTIVRAIEINLVGDPLATLALANAAAGPSTAPALTPTTPAPTTTGPVNTNIPTGVPAGFATPGASPELPLVLLVLGLLMAGCGAVAWKWRGKHVR